VFGESIYAEFASMIAVHYDSISKEAADLSYNGTRHEPHVAQRVFEQLLERINVSVWLGRHVVGVEHNSLTEISEVVVASSGSSSGDHISVLSSVFIDASYEGDLLALAGARFRLGREGRKEHGELNAGVVFQDDSKQCFLRGSTGEPSPRLPAMTWRLCFTDNVTNRMTLTQPPFGYNRSKYLGYIADVSAGRMSKAWDAWSSKRPLPPTGRKYDMNCNPRPLGFVWTGAEKETYVKAAGLSEWTLRQDQLAALQNVTVGLLWFLQHDEAVAEAERAANQKYGLCRDEFSVGTQYGPHGRLQQHYNGYIEHFPPQLCESPPAAHSCSHFMYSCMHICTCSPVRCARGTEVAWAKHPDRA
jgi:hypothetical protein